MHGAHSALLDHAYLSCHDHDAPLPDERLTARRRRGACKYRVGIKQPHEAPQAAFHPISIQWGRRMSSLSLHPCPHMTRARAPTAFHSATAGQETEHVNTLAHVRQSQWGWRAAAGGAPRVGASSLRGCTRARQPCACAARQPGGSQHAPSRSCSARPAG